ncbi:hypothetical protein [Celeribacter ethanolicus]|uniref:hypothetical protein n=1 Tax=Celeribacter ethanolicus TaxID=1758178 RepID=UPI0012DCA425|nr:hypothetical protein [Celeribacter ethanolicus]
MSKFHVKRVRRLRRDLAIGLLCLGGLWATETVAGCPQGQEAFTSCQIEGRGTEVFVCFDNQVATYSYGPVGGPADLILSVSIEQVDFEPWSGLGTAISESITFYNRDYGYTIGGGFERPFSEEDMQRPPRRFGWVEVTESGERAAWLECIPDTVSYGFGGGIYDAKMAAGLVWDWDSETWVSDRILSETTPVLREHHEFGVVSDCLPAAEFRLNGVKMGDPLDALGTAEATDDVSFSDEPIDRMALAGAYIDFFQDAVVTMTATSPGWHMPSGLSVGLTRGDVIRILGRVPSGYTARAQGYTIPVCSENNTANPDVSFGQWFALIDFGEDKRVDRMTLVTSTE